MSDQKYPTYPASSMNEILLNVPTGKLAVCMRDMTAGLLQAAEMRDQFEAISAALGAPFDREEFVNAIPWVWVDDGKCVVKTTVKATLEGESVSVSREVDHLASEQRDPVKVPRLLLEEAIEAAGIAGHDSLCVALEQLLAGDEA